MVVYIKNKYIFLINLNCCYVLFEKLRDIGDIKYCYNYNFPAIIITRNPYENLELFYKEWFIKKMSSDFLNNYNNNLLNYFSKEMLINNKITFEMFIKSLENGYSNEFINPQFQLLVQTNRLIKNNGLLSFNRGAPPIYNIKIENDLYKLEKLGINLYDYENDSVSNINCDLTWTPEMRFIVNKLYAKDFILFGYTMII